MYTQSTSNMVIYNTNNTDYILLKIGDKYTSDAIGFDIYLTQNPNELEYDLLSKFFIDHPSYKPNYFL